MKKNNRLVIVSNRLPLTIVEKKGKISFKSSCGGLATALDSYNKLQKKTGEGKNDNLWIGWAGKKVEDLAKQEELRGKLLKEEGAYPVFLSDLQIENFYSGFSNQVVWPLFHYFSEINLETKFWDEYKVVNELFCQSVLENIQPEDTIFIHDYHLMLLPKLLREKGVKNPISFFLHTPFPNFAMFKTLPKNIRAEILKGIIASDVAGFHTKEYADYFLESVKIDLGIEAKRGNVALGENLCEVSFFPIGIDFDKFFKATMKKGSSGKNQESRKGVKQIISVDRLDYTKGIVNRLKGFKNFLIANPDYENKVVLNLIVAPSRTTVKSYRKLKTQIDSLVFQINKRFKHGKWEPISYNYKEFSFEKLVRLYKSSQMALVTPVRDGMNLVAKEFVASRNDHKGVLVLSEFAGASSELAEAIKINPNSPDEIALAIKQALEMAPDEQIRRNKLMQARLKKATVSKWVSQILKATIKAMTRRKLRQKKIFNLSIKNHLIDNYLLSTNRLILLDYDGTLMPYAKNPDPEVSKPTDRLLRIMKNLSHDIRNDVFVVSGRDRATLNNYFKIPYLGLSAEHGVWVKKNGHWNKSKQVTNEWKKEVTKLFDSYKHDLPGSIIEEKEFSVALHYRQASLASSPDKIKDMVWELLPFVNSRNLQLLPGNKVIEIKNNTVNKGMVVKKMLEENDYDFIMAIGDDLTDEDLFRVLPQSAYSLKVGSGHSVAKYSIAEVYQVIELLSEVSQITSNSRDEVIEPELQDYLSLTN